MIPPNFVTTDHEGFTFLQGTSYARAFENGSLPPILPSITLPHQMLITRVLQRGASAGILWQIGKRLVPYYGFTENVRSYLVTVCLDYH